MLRLAADTHLSNDPAAVHSVLNPLHMAAMVVVMTMVMHRSGLGRRADGKD